MEYTYVIESRVGKSLYIGGEGTIKTAPDSQGISIQKINLETGKKDFSFRTEASKEISQLLEIDYEEQTKVYLAAAVRDTFGVYFFDATEESIDNALAYTFQFISALGQNSGFYVSSMAYIETKKLVLSLTREGDTPEVIFAFVPIDTMASGLVSPV